MKYNIKLLSLFVILSVYSCGSTSVNVKNTKQYVNFLPKGCGHNLGYGYAAPFDGCITDYDNNVAYSFDYISENVYIIYTHELIDPDCQGSVLNKTTISGNSCFKLPYGPPTSFYFTFTENNYVNHLDGVELTYYSQPNCGGSIAFYAFFENGYTDKTFNYQYECMDNTPTVFFQEYKHRASFPLDGYCFTPDEGLEISNFNGTCVNPK
ncbi:hypothetical protein PPL_08004 [Heterostelium album PN500]|uniref:Lipoprotein n=1 Tax=Heterostelium pallidum (strain ATCC 26659 / Pp 5 / PN500) TaxID=670386 RepID=D3BHK1_HETP5|nr:hypothetical protein PPL_08004 [Heterostelium album PN500]EFA79178.1 hypothetical protein PPL_08004 [Heterostelium album PN500]|eukprot:XP_020431299.1 hypothetical protein PPL_08004 [Heterostelium album PN500]